MGVVVKLEEEKTLVVVGLADIAVVALVEDGGVNTVKETAQTQHKAPLLIDCLVRCTGCRCRDGY